MSDELLRELAETVHRTGSLRDHSDPNDHSGWNVHGIETCTDLLCVDALAALAAPPRFRDSDERAWAGTHGRDCQCSACRRQDWNDPTIVPGSGNPTPEQVADYRAAILRERR